MKTFFGSIYHVLASSNTVQQLWCIGLLVVLLILAVLHHKWKGDKKKIRIWRFLCLLPLVICVVHFFIYVFGFLGFATRFILLYAISVFALIPIFFANRKIGYRISATLAGILIILCSLYFVRSAPNNHNFVHKSYTASFHALVKTLDKEYILKEWKEVDFNALEEKYMPLVQEAEAEQNPQKFGDAVNRFCSEIYDAHIGVMCNYDRGNFKTVNMPHEYGLSTVRIDSGEIIAICTSAKVNELGIKDGTVITKWDGKKVEEAAQEVIDMGIASQPVKENTDVLAVFNLSHVGGEKIEVSFLDEKGYEKTVTLTDLGKYETTTKALSLFSRMPIMESREDTEAFEENNFSTKMLNYKCGYLQIIAESTDNDFHDRLGYLTGNHKWAREMFREKLRDLKKQGMEYLVIDIRGNMGGFDEIACALCDLFATEDKFALGLGIRRDGNYINVSEHNIHADGEFADIPVVVLTNFACASAGDGLALYLSKLPNVTVAGITDPCGINQETGGCCILSDDLVRVTYPTGLVLDENGEPNIDTRADRISRNPVDVRIPFDSDAAMKIFRDNVDYELEWAIDYIEKN